MDGGGRGRPAAATRLFVLVGVLVAAVAGSLVLPAVRRDRWLRLCSRAVLRVAGVRLRVSGGDRFTGGAGALVVANHMSWIDVLALEAVQPVRMLAKCEVRDWPVVGPLAVRTGAVFVDRAGLRTLPATVAATADALRAGAAVGVFPEGTTWCGEAAGAFHRAAFQAALDAGVPVRPVAIAFRSDRDGDARGAAFVGEQTLLDSLRRVVAVRGLTCEVTLLPALPVTAGLDRRELAHLAESAIGAVTGVRHGTGRRVRPPAVPVAA